MARSIRLAIDEVASNNAIHGLTRWLNWQLLDRPKVRCALDRRCVRRPGYPFSLALEIDYALSDLGLTVRTTAHNRGTRPCRSALGSTRTSRSARR